MLPRIIARLFEKSGIGKVTSHRVNQPTRNPKLVDGVQGGVNNGLGPRFNTNQCASCHAQPNVGGTSPSISAFPFIGMNPEIQFASSTNTLPSFITPDGPVREARFKFLLNSNGSLSTTPDGGVHDLFVITGRPTPARALSLSRISRRT